MNWVTSTEIRNWAQRRECQENLPLLVRKLIRSTTNDIKKIKFPSGDNVQMGGWDGVLISGEANDFVPLGTSLWEFGATSKVKDKADEDYKKRSENAIGYTPAESVFVFVTPRLWSTGEAWAEEKRAEGIWRDVVVINSERLEEWIDISPAVGSWLARHIGIIPPSGFESADEFWEAWSQGPEHKIIPELLLGGRDQNKSNLVNELQSPNLSVIHSSSRQESIAFGIASVISIPEQKEDFLSRTIIVDNKEVFRQLTASQKKLILIARFVVEEGLHYATKQGHNVIIPKGADFAGNNESSILPRIEMESFRSNLEAMGISQENAEKYSKESARSLPVFRRLLGFSLTDPEWSKPDNVRDIIPAILIGRWNEHFEGDRTLVESLSGTTYDEYIQKLSIWLNSPDSPVVRIGSTWRLTSPLDIWTHVSNKLIRSDFANLFDATQEILKEIHPKFERPAGKRFIPPMGGYEIKYSDWIRKGVVQSLCLISILGEKLNFDLAHNPASEIDAVVRSILQSDDRNLWKTLSSELPLIAEASPTSFMNTVNTKLQIENGPIHSLFEEEEGFMTNMSYHSGLLWALEGLAWLPEYFTNSIILLAKLASIDPGGQLANRPSNSLKEIFTVWRYQTLADFDTRMKTLKKISETYPEICASLLQTMLPDSNTVSMANHHLRWRTFEIETRGQILNQEVFDTYAYVIDLLIELTEVNQEQIIVLVKASTKFSPSDRTKAFEKINAVIGETPETSQLWHELRWILNHHRTYKTANWSLNEEQLTPYEALHDSIVPNDTTEKYKWLFDDAYPLFKEGHDIRDIRDEKRQERINKERTQAANELYNNLSIDELSALVVETKVPYFLGRSLGEVLNNEAEIISLIKNMDESYDWKIFLSGFGCQKEVLEGTDWIFNMVDKLKEDGIPLELSIALFLGLSSNNALWTQLSNHSEELHTLFWKKTDSYFRHESEEEKIQGIQHLIDVNRFFFAIHHCYLEDELPTSLLITLLKKAATEEAEDTYQPRPYEIERVLEQLSERQDADKSDLITLEWMYMSVTYNMHGRNIKILQNELIESPEFFVDVLSWVYKSDNDDEQEETELTEEQISNRFMKAHRLLDSFDKIPGLNGDEQNEDILTNWITEVRTRAEAKGRLSSADICIGKLLGRYPGNDENWPGDFICSTIENIGTDEILRTFSSSIFNKQSFTSRGVFDGGDIERGRAEYYQQLADTHRINYPKIADVFDNLSRNYLEDAKRWDEDAERTRLEH